MKASSTFVAALVVSLIGACGQAASPPTAAVHSPAAVASTSPAAVSGATPAALPTAALPTSNLPAFQCAPATGGGSLRSDIVAVRVGSASGYDRFVVEFSGAVPGFKVSPQSSPSLVADPSGRTFTLSGASALKVTLNPSSGQGTYTGPSDFTPSYPALREARLMGDFEAVTTWGLGLNGSGCFRAFTLTSPSRLVIDVQSA
jgi:hypothetical protein